MMMMLLKTGFSTFSALIYELQLPLFYFYYMLITVLLRINGLLSKVGQRGELLLLERWCRKM